MGDLQLAGQRVLVTGAASGIGRATAEFLVAEGARVAGLDRRAEDCADLGCVTALGADVTSGDQVEAAVTAAAEALGGIDTLIHAAGITLEARTDLRELSEESFRKVIEVNLVGSFLLARACARVMVPAGGGLLVLVGSPAGVTGPSSSIPYGASKGGVNGLALTLAEHLAKDHIRVVNVMPSAVDTPLVARSLATGEEHGADPSIAQRFRANMVAPSDVARVLAMTASPLMSHLKGPVFTR